MEQHFDGAGRFADNVAAGRTFVSLLPVTPFSLERALTEPRPLRLVCSTHTGREADRISTHYVAEKVSFRLVWGVALAHSGGRELC